jgi:hypothetical protein
MANGTVTVSRNSPLTRSHRDLATLLAISLTAFALSNFLHEGAGHGGACVLAGGHAQVLSSVHFECDQSSPFIAAGGTLVNLIAGFFAWIALRAANPSRERWRYFLWLFMTINFLQAAGYFLFSGVSNFGDWAEVIHGLQPAWLWRAALAVFGMAAYMCVVWMGLLELRPFLGKQDYRRGAVKDLTVIPYLTGGILYVVAGMFNPVGMVLVGLSAAAASFGGASGLAWMTQYLSPKLVPANPSQPLTVERSLGWVFAAVIITAIFVGVLGRGVRFQ